MKRAVFAAILACAACGPPKKDTVRIAVGGQSALRFLPVYLARELGYFEAEGLNVTIDGLAGSAKAMQAVIAGSADVGAGFYDQTIAIAAEGRDVRSFLTMTTHLGFVVTGAPGSKHKITKIADLRGAIVGVAAPGSSGHMLLNYLLARNGMQPEDVSVTGFGSGGTAIAALEHGTVDAGVHADLVLIPILRKHPDLPILADTRTDAGLSAVFGSAAYPGSVLYANQTWLATHGETARKTAHAVRKAMAWAREHNAGELAAKLAAVYPVEDRSILAEALRGTTGIISTDGRLPAGAPETVLRVLAESNPKLKQVRLDLSHTYTDAYLD